MNKTTEQDMNAATMPVQIDRLVKALSGVRSLSNIEIKQYLEHELHQLILKTILRYVDLESCSLFINRDGVLKCAAGASWGDQANNTILRFSNSYHTFEFGKGILGQAAEKEILIYCRDCQSDPDFLQLSDKNNTKVGSLISAPVLSCGKLIGVLNISHPETNFFESWHEKIMLTYANIIAQILQNHTFIHAMEAEIYEQTRELKIALKESNDLRKRYQELSFIDYLTEIYNRRYFFPEFSSAIANAQRNQHTLTLLILDLDLFKSINDNYGHELGDAVLIGVSQLLKRQIRKGDVLARLGGEEFAIALRGTDVSSARQFADRLRMMISELNWSYQNDSITVTVSIGLSSLHQLDVAADDAVRIMMSEADMALYSCKENGRNQVKAYEDLESSGSSRSIS